MVASLIKIVYSKIHFFFFLMPKNEYGWYAMIVAVWWTRKEVGSVVGTGKGDKWQVYLNFFYIMVNDSDQVFTSLYYVF